MNAVVTISQIALGLGALVALVRAIKGPSLADRIIAVDLILLLTAGGFAMEAARGGTQLFWPLVTVVALVAFTGTVFVARFIEWRDTR